MSEADSVSSDGPVSADDPKSAGTIAQERRRHARKPVELLAEVAIGDADSVEAKCINISLGGAQLELADPPAYGTVVKLTLYIGPENVLHIAATSRWTGNSTLGVQFGSLRARDAYALSELVASLASL